MATGYTDIISRGATFEEFVLRCARAFGAFVEMRDSSLDATIPDEFKPSTYHAENLAKAKQRLASIESWSLTNAEIAANADYCLEEVRIREAIEKNRKTIAAYKDMLYRVSQWQPPTSEHEELKEFMVEQIEKSLKFDDIENYYLKHPAKRLTGKEWLAKAVSSAEQDISYHTEQNQKEIEGAASRTKWVQELRESLKGN